jgi:hypothetical protein
MSTFRDRYLAAMRKTVKLFWIHPAATLGKAHLEGDYSILESSEELSSQSCFFLALCSSITNIVR